MLNIDVSLTENRKSRTRIAVVMTGSGGEKTYYRSVGHASKQTGLTSSQLKALALMRATTNDGATVEFVPASTVAEYLPAVAKRMRRTNKRERGILVSASVSKETYAALMDIVLHTGISRTKMVRAAVEAMVASYAKADTPPSA